MNEPEQLLDAIEQGDFPTFEKLLATCPGIANARIKGDATLLMRALTLEDIQPLFIRRLIEAGAEVNATTSEGYSALHHIAHMRPIDDTSHVQTIARLLVSAGANREQRTHWGWTPLIAVAMEGTIEQFKALLEMGCCPDVVCGESSLPDFSRGLRLGHLVIAKPEFVGALLDHGYRYDESIFPYALNAMEECRTAMYPGKTPESDASHIAAIERSMEAIRKRNRQPGHGP